MTTRGLTTKGTKDAKGRGAVLREVAGLLQRLAKIVEVEGFMRESDGALISYLKSQITDHRSRGDGAGAMATRSKAAVAKGGAVERALASPGTRTLKRELQTKNGRRGVGTTVTFKI